MERFEKAEQLKDKLIEILKEFKEWECPMLLNSKKTKSIFGNRKLCEDCIFNVNIYIPYADSYRMCDLLEIIEETFRK